VSVTPRRFRAGDIILASGSVFLLVAILAHVTAAPATPAIEPAHRHEAPPESIGDAAPEEESAAPATTSPSPAPRDECEAPTFVPNSRTIKSWGDLPVHVVHRPHWVSGRRHPRPPQGNGIDYKLRNAELHLELLGYDAESIRFAFDLVNRLDAAVAGGLEGGEAAARLLDLARGKGAGEIARAFGDGVNEESVRIRALAILASHGSEAVAEQLLTLATTEDSAGVRTAAGVSLHWMGRAAEASRWVASEAASKAVGDFFDAIQVGVNTLEEPRLARTLVFRDTRAVESSTLVDMLLEGAAAARWDTATRAKSYEVAAKYGGERADVAAWMEREYGRASDDLTRASILFAAPRVRESGRLEDLAVQVARAGGSGYVVRTALFSLGQFRTERSLRVLMEVTPKCGEDTAGHAIRALERLAPWFGKEIEPFLKGLAAGHPEDFVRAEAAAALKRSFEGMPK
jgi:HEAT repeat protein